MSILEMERAPSPLMAPEAADSPETGPPLVFDVMGEGFAAEADPQPLATIVAGNTASAEAVLAKIAELSDRMDGTAADGRFKPLTLADLQEAIEDIEIADRPVRDTSSVEEIVKSSTIIRAGAGHEMGAAGEGKGRSLLLGLNRSRLGRAVATTALVAVGTLAWASSASAKGLKDTCAPTIFDKGTVLESEMHNPGKNNQDVVINIHVNEVDPRCDGAFKRVVSVKPQIKHRGQQKWTNLGFYTPIYIGDTSPANDIGGVWFSNPSKRPWLLYREGDRVRFLEKIQEKNEGTGRIVGTRISPHRVLVIGG